MNVVFICSKLLVNFRDLKTWFNLSVVLPVSNVLLMTGKLTHSDAI
jgi:hypothetical protein